MTDLIAVNEDDPRDLVLSLTMNASRRNIWRCWTEAELLTQWFTPHPWTTASADLDPRAGGRMNVVMCSPEGEKMPNNGIYLEVLPERRLVFTDAYVEGWRPGEKPFMTAIVELEDAEAGGTAYRARARHWSAEDRDRHETMGFHDGWTMAARQLETLAQTL